MELTHEIWQKLKGGYKVCYDASIPLRQLEESDNPETISEIFNELWNELHHQGDVGLASYYSVPHLVRIGIEKNLFDRNILGLCAVIEQQRHLGNNPPLPVEIQASYFKSFETLKEFVIKNLSNSLDKTTSILALSTIATCDGRFKLGKLIMELEDEDLLNDLLENI